MVLVMANEKGLVNSDSPKERHMSVGDLVIRSVSMSANVASSVWQEVNHLIHVNTGFNLKATTNLQNESKCRLFVQSPEFDSVCSPVLPTNDNVLLGVVISRWDDIVGPQTVHMWIQNLTHGESQDDVVTSLEDNKIANITAVLKAIHYVTCHTVNCTSVTATNGANSMFVVPDLDMLSIAHLFHSCHDSISTPFSVAVIANFKHYSHLQRKYDSIQQWLKRFVQRLKPLLEKWPTAADIELGKEVDTWVLDVNTAVNATTQAQLDKFPWQQIPTCVLKHPALMQGLTSHLQTFGCSVIIGNSSSQVNAVIAFFSLFLSENERSCSRLVPSSMQCCFHLGLYLQGLLLNGYGYREISSCELAANQYPVTIVELSAEEGAVKQTLMYHQHIAFQQQHSALCDSETKSVVHPVKESAKLVRSLIKELTLLPLRYWKKHINNFKKKIYAFAQMLINLLHHSSLVMGSPTKSNVVQKFKKNFDLGDADFFIILAEAEKIRPGLFCYVAELMVIG